MSATRQPPAYAAQSTIIPASAGAAVQAFVEGLPAALLGGRRDRNALLLALEGAEARGLLASLQVHLALAGGQRDLLVGAAGDATPLLAGLRLRQAAFLVGDAAPD